MKLFPEDSVFDIGKVGFDGKDADDRPYDVLGRKPLGQKLTVLVDRIEQPLVIALDGGWGSGKSHFLKLWTGAHQLELGGKAEVIYFDAFEHDYLDDPLVSLVSRLISQGDAKAWPQAAILKLKKAAFPLARVALRIGAAITSAGITEVAGPVIDAVAGKVGEATDDKIKEFWQVETGRIAAMKQFRDALEALTEPKVEGGARQKIVFIVDELDRCRPDYALSLLEIIKHFFAVPNVHFVLGVNLDALSNSVVAQYGPNIDGAKYLQKFVSVTMHLPRTLQHNPNIQSSIAYFNNVHAQFIQSAELAAETRDRLADLARQQDLTLRDVQRLMTCLALMPNSFDSFHWGLKTLIVGAAFLRVLHPTAYSKLRAQRLNIDDLAASLSIAQPQSDADRQPQHRDWCVWVRALEGQSAWARHSISTEIAVHVEKAFSHWGDGFEWREAQAIFADMFDSFTLPSR